MSGGKVEASAMGAVTYDALHMLCIRTKIYARLAGIATIFKDSSYLCLWVCDEEKASTMHWGWGLPREHESG